MAGRGMLVGVIAVTGVAVLPAAAIAQQAVAPTATLTANGTGTVRPVPADPHSDASIRAAVDAAVAKALPLAVSDARAQAAALATASGVKLGELLSIADTPAPGYPFAFSPQFGTFGDGHFCGRQRNFKTVVRADGLRRRVAIKGTHKVCRVPSSVQAGVALTYAVAG